MYLIAQAKAWEWQLFNCRSRIILNGLWAIYYQSEISLWLSFIGFSILYRKVSVVLPKQFFTAAFSKNATPEP
jgi:hypothetical protein